MKFGQKDRKRYLQGFLALIARFSSAIWCRITTKRLLVSANYLRVVS